VATFIGTTSSSPDGILGELCGSVPEFVFFEVIGCQFGDCSNSIFTVIRDRIEALFELSAPPLFRSLRKRLRTGLCGFLYVPPSENEVVPINVATFEDRHDSAQPWDISGPAG
jgi:hypothetical protein